MKIKIYADGASRGNPGQASYGFVIISNGKILYKGNKRLGITTNNVAEYNAVLNALNYVKKNLKNISEVEVLADSKLVIEQLSGIYKIKSKHLKPIIEKIQILSLELGGVFYTHIPREQNMLADSLANQALDNS